MKKLLFAMAFVMLMCQPVLASTNYNVCFSSLDADVNDSMSKSEFMVAFPDGDEAVFAAADGDKDGAVSHEEWEDYKAAQGWEEDH